MASERAVRLVGQLMIAGIFLFAGGQKVLTPAAFTESILAYGIVSRPVAVLLAFYLPWLELAAGLAFLIPSWRRAASYVLASLLLAFTLAICLVWFRGLPLDCGCFGGWWSGAKSPAWSVARNLGLMALLVALGIRSRGNGPDRCDLAAEQIDQRAIVGPSASRA